MNIFRRFLVFLMLLSTSLVFVDYAQSELVIRVTKGADNPFKIAIVPFRATASVDTDVAARIGNDLSRFGEFRVLPRNQYLSLPSDESEVIYREWKLIKVDYLLIGTVAQGRTEAELLVEYKLFDVVSGKLALEDSVYVAKPALVRAAHHISDKIYERLVDLPGLFSTKIVYVSEEVGRLNPYVLKLTDMDGGRDTELFRSANPILSPDWSPDGRQVAYVSFENYTSNVIVQDLATGSRRVVANFPGINSSPSWSPDGKSLLVTLSYGENPDIYLLDLSSGRTSRLTTHAGIDTEATWSPDGKSILFTSDRDGSPHLFTLEIRDKKVKRLTTRGNYNARGRYLPDGERISLVHRRGSGALFQIAILNIKTGILNTLTEEALDESPCIAPNGNIILYATQVGEEKVLAGVTLNGKSNFILPSSEGRVKDPDWSPFFR